MPDTDSQVDLGTNSVRVRNIYGDTLYGDGSNLTGISVGVQTEALQSQVLQHILI